MTGTWPDLQLAAERPFGELSRQSLARQARTGLSVRVARGGYEEAAVWEQLTPRERHIVRARAMTATGRQLPVLSHFTAAAVHGLPFLGSWPDEIHTIIGKSTGGRSRSGVVKHAIRLDDADVVEVDGLRVTSLARTVIDVAACLPAVGGVIAADRALLLDRFGRRPPLLRQHQLLELWERMLPFQGHTRARDVILFADGRAESPLESASRVNMRIVGVPQPALQQSYHDAQGWIGDSDFSWEDYDLIGEADGDAKYLDAGLRNGRSAEQVVLDEKIREDRLRALPRRVTRWRWSVGISADRLWAHLSAAGLPCGRTWAPPPL